MLELRRLCFCVRVALPAFADALGVMEMLCTQDDSYPTTQQLVDRMQNSLEALRLSVDQAEASIEILNGHRDKPNGGLHP